MNKQQATTVANEYFPTYPSANELHVTADAQVFHERHHAENHAKSFADKSEQTVHTISKEDGFVQTEVVAVTPLQIGVPNEAIINAEKPETITLVSDEDAPSIAASAQSDKPSDGVIVETADTAPNTATTYGKKKK